MRAAVAAIVLVFASTFAHARPTHGEIAPLAAGVELDGLEYDPIPVGRLWNYRDNVGNRYRRLVVRGETVLGRGKKAPLLETRTRELYAVEKDEKLRPVEKTVLYADWPTGVALVGITETQEGKPPRVLEEPVIEMAKKLRAGTTWKSGEAKARVAGEADVSVTAGEYPGCVVIELAGGYKLPDGKRTDVRRFYAKDVGEVFAAVLVSGSWRPAMELEALGALPTTVVTEQPGARR